MIQLKKILKIQFIILLSLSLTFCTKQKDNIIQEIPEVKNQKVGIAWRADTDTASYKNFTETLDVLNVDYKLLDEVCANEFPMDGAFLDDECKDERYYLKQEYADIVKNIDFDKTNVKEVLGDCNYVIFTGGQNMSPTLYKTSNEYEDSAVFTGHDITRDVSDYILMSYCIENDINILAICRGMEVLGVVSGTPLIQDIKEYFEFKHLPYNNEHRLENVSSKSQFGYAAHDVEIIDKDSMLYKMFNRDIIKKVPSLHHQAIENVVGTNLKVTGIANTSGINLIEAVERTDKHKVIGLQFHPEVAVAKNIHDAANKNDFMNYDDALNVFKYFLDIIPN